MRRCVVLTSRLTARCGGQREHVKSRQGLVARFNSPRRTFMLSRLALLQAALPQKDLHLFWRVFDQHALMLALAYIL